MAAGALLGPGWREHLLPGLLLAGAIAGAEWEGWTLKPRRSSLKQAIRGAGDGAVAAALLLPFFLCLLYGWRHWVQDVPLHLATSGLTAEAVLGHLLLAAVPEEVFFRGYVQRALDTKMGLRWRIGPAEVGPGWLVASILFALVHIPVFGLSGLFRVFPGLVFGWLYAVRRSIAGPIVFHWASNVLILAIAPKADLFGLS